jgi:predicted O-methyltransferase YrrM
MIKEILQHKPQSIFDVCDADFFFERNDPKHAEYIESGNYYEIYYAICKYFQPKRILEIGVRYGYSLYAMASACDEIDWVVGYDIDDYEKGSIEIANKNLRDKLGRDRAIVINRNSQNLIKLNEVYNLIHIDGDHTYNGKVHDLNLTLNATQVVIVDDYTHIPLIKKAVDEFCQQNADKIETHFLITSARGTYIIKYKI